MVQFRGSLTPTKIRQSYPNKETQMRLNEFKTDLGMLNRLSTAERSLDNFLYACRSMNVPIDSRYSTTTELLEKYMAAVRSRNKVRRNWHPSKAHSCDIETLQWIAK
jgi:hypothetical protein